MFNNRSQITFIRNYIRKGQGKFSQKTDVQLLKNLKNFGVKGQIVSVNPSFMRQQLHPKKIAAYIIDGPKIPVVVPKVHVHVPPPPVKKENIPKQTTVGTFNMDELSDLFKTNRRKVEEFTFNVASSDSSDATYTSSQVRKLMAPEVYLKEMTFPITKTYLTEYAYKMTGLEIPETAIRLTDENKKRVSEIKTAGIYTWFINSPEKRETKITLTVNN